MHVLPIGNNDIYAIINHSLQIFVFVNCIRAENVPLFLRELNKFLC